MFIHQEHHFNSSVVLLRRSREVQSNPSNFLDQSDTHFKECIVCDATFHDSYQQGIGTSKKSAEISTQEAEGMQWIIINFNTTILIHYKSSVLLHQKGLLFEGG